ncbi:MAG TPA: helix-turn-helix domain-containing protein [Planctomycetota bacterium]|nr:helix-turn-helix domain-containing protein [Planctomycetota bacterium]
MARDDAVCRLIHCGRLRARRRAVFTAHDHPCHELIVPLRGRLRARLASGEAVAGPGTLLWYPAGSRHLESIEADADADWRYLLIEAAGIDLPLTIVDRDGAVRQMSSLIAADDQVTAASAAKRHALAAAIVAELQRLAAGHGGGDDDLVRTVDLHVHRHLASPLSLERLARVAGVSRSYFARAYRQRAGCAPMAAVRSARIAAARELLLTTDLPLRVIAAQVGIGSEYLLSRLIARHLGTGARLLRRGGRRTGRDHVR